MLKVRKLVKRYDDKNILKKITFDLKKEEILSIVGASGCGKTTLMKSIAGLLDFEEGEIFLDDELLKPKSQKLIAGNKGVELVHQDFKMFPHHDIEENLKHKLQWLKPLEQKKRIKELLSLCRLEKIAHFLPRQLSGGQKQRIAIALALATKPKLLLLDEPFNNLDTPTKIKLRKDIVRIIRAEKMSAIMVTHDGLEALTISDQIILMQKGVIIQKCDPKTIYDDPKNKYVADFFSETILLSNTFLNQNNILTNIDPNKKYYTRIENINIDPTSNIKAKIVNKIFCGSYFNYDLVVDNEQNLSLNSALEYELESETGVNINSNKILVD